MALIPPFFLDCVVAIGTLDEKGKTIWVGTGFLVGKFIETVNDDSSNYNPFLVTNRHVLKDLKQIVIRFNPQTNQAAKDFIIDATDATGNKVWTGHTDEKIDVAVIDINAETLEKEGLNYGLFTTDQTFITSQQMKDKGVSEGDFIYVLGYPMGLVGADRQHAILRSGVIARIRDMFEEGNPDYVIDAFVFPGNSGGPVILKPEMVSIKGTQANSDAGLIGILKSYIPFQDIAVSQQTGKARVIFEENTGLALVEPVDYILETIELHLKNKITGSGK